MSSGREARIGEIAADLWSRLCHKCPADDIIQCRCVDGILAAFKAVIEVDRNYQSNGHDTAVAENPFLDTAIDDLDFGPIYTARIQNFARNHQRWVYHDGTERGSHCEDDPIVTVRDLVKLSRWELMHQVNIGHKTVDLITRTLAEHDLRLATR